MKNFFGAGIPNLDYYQWKVIGPNGVVLKSANGGAGLQTFPELVEHTIELEVSRAGQAFLSKTKKVNVVKGAKVLSKDNYFLCGSSGLTLNAIDPSTPEISYYVFEWQDGAGNPLGINTNTIAITNTGDYKVRHYS